MDKALELSENMNDSFGLMFEKNKFRNSNMTGNRTLVKQEPDRAFRDLQTMQQEISTMKDTLETIQKTARSNSSELKEHFEQLLKRQSAVPVPGILRPPSQFSMSSTTCLYCDQNGHMIRQCPEKEEDLRTGKIQVNAMGRIVLADGSLLDKRAPLMSQVRKPPTRVHFVESQFTNEFEWANNEPETSIRPIAQLYQAPTLDRSQTDEKLDKLTGSIEKMTLLMSTFINTRQKEYGDPYQEK
jgi:TolA-binding protein